MKYALFTILFCLGAYGQEAYVVALGPADAVHAKASFERLQQAQKDWDEEQKEISRKYLIVDPTDPDASGAHYTEDTSLSGIIAPFASGSSSISWLGANSCAGVAATGGPIAVDCRTGKPTASAPKEELAQRAKEDKERQDRYVRERRQRRGFDTSCSNCLPRFDFSHDFKFIVPPKPTPEPLCQNCTPMVAW